MSDTPNTKPISEITVDDIHRAAERLRQRDSLPYVHRAYWRGVITGGCFTSMVVGIILTISMLLHR